MSDSENQTINDDIDMYSDFDSDKKGIIMITDSDKKGDDNEITISIFLIYLIESIITGGIIFFAILKNYDEIKIFDDFKKNIIILSISFIFFNLFNLVVTNLCIKFDVNAVFNFILFIILALFKISFILLALNFFHTQIIPFEINSYVYLYWKAGTSLYYLILILIKVCKNNIHISIFFIIGIVTSGASFGFQYLHSEVFADAEISGALGLIEVIFLCIAFIYGLAKDKLSYKRFFEKVVLTDSYKYYLVFIIIVSVPILLTVCLIAICKSCCENFNCESIYYSSSEKETKKEKPEKTWWEKEQERKEREREPCPSYIVNGFAYDRQGRLWNFK